MKIELRGGQRWDDRVVLFLKNGNVRYLWVPAEEHWGESIAPAHSRCKVATFKAWIRRCGMTRPTEDEVDEAWLMRALYFANLKSAEDSPKWQAMYLAMAVRNNLEDFHSKHLSDDQMKEVNQLVRGGIYTGLVAMDMVRKVLHGKADADTNFKMAARWMGFQMQMVPDYWEAPVLMNDFVAVPGEDDDEV